MASKSCAWVDQTLVVETDGWTRPCCLETSSTARISRIEDGILNAWNSSIRTDLKNELDGPGFTDKTEPYCRRCRQVEERGEPSLRMVTPAIPGTGLRSIQFKLSNRCQLACVHCGPELSSTWARIANKSPRVINAINLTDEFISEMRSILPNLAWIKFTGGEPFMDQSHWKLLEALADLRRDHCELHYVTNGLLKPRSDLWAGWKGIRCQVSVDGHGRHYEWFRRGANWEELVNCCHDLSPISQVSILYSMTPWTIECYRDAVVALPWKISTIPIVSPKHASLIGFPREILARMSVDDRTPHYNLSTSIEASIEPYVRWARKWDEIWKTPGLSKELYPWTEI